MFGGAPELVTPDQRRAAKVINFGILYGMSAFGLGRNLGIPSGEADRFIKAYLERYPKIRQYIEETLKSAQRDGRVETLFGRVRYLPDIKSKNFALRENARRMAINARVQGTAADLQKKAMIAVDRRAAQRPSASQAAAHRARRAGARGARERGARASPSWCGARWRASPSSPCRSRRIPAGAGPGTTRRRRSGGRLWPPIGTAGTEARRYESLINGSGGPPWPPSGERSRNRPG